MVRTAYESGLGNARTNALPNVAQQEQRLNIPRGAGGLPGGEAAGQIGEGLANLSTGLDRLQKEQDALVASQLDENFQREVMAASYDPDSGFFAQTGGSAIGLPKVAEERLTALRQKYEAQASNPRVAQLFSRAAARTQQSTLEAVARHTISQQSKYRDERADSTMRLAADKVALNPSDDSVFQQELAQANSAAVAKARLDGASPERLNELTYEAGSTVYAARIGSLMRSDDPTKILQGNALFKDAQLSGKLTQKHVQALDDLQKGSVPKALALNAVAEGRSAAGQAFQNLPADQIFDTAMVMTESNGKQFGPDGRPLTSKAGAIGAAQVMPATAPEAARLAGLPWDEVKYKTDREYNLALGRAYYGYLVNKYEDKTLATMAYNGGLGNVDEHISKVGDPRMGQVSMGQFVASFPLAETRNYVASVQRRLGVGSGKIDAGFAVAKASELDKEMPGAGDVFLTAYKRNNDIIEEAEKDYNLQIKQRAAEQLAMSNGDISAIDNLTAAELKRTGQWDEVTKYDGSTDTSVLMNLRLMKQEEFAQVDLRQYAASLSRADLLKEQERQDVLKKGDGEYKTFSKDAENYWIRITGDNKASKDKANFLIRADAEFQSFRDTNQRPPNAQEARGILQQLTLKSDGGLFGSGPAGYKYEPNAEFSVGGVPRGEVPYYTRALETLGFDATEDNIKTMYKNPQGFFGNIPGVPQEQVRNIVNKLARSGLPITNANIRAVYSRAAQQSALTPEAPANPAPAAPPSTGPLASRNDFLYGD